MGQANAKAGSRANGQGTTLIRIQEGQASNSEAMFSRTELSVNATAVLSALGRHQQGSGLVRVGFMADCKQPTHSLEVPLQ